MDDAIGGVQISDGKIRTDSIQSGTIKTPKPVSAYVTVVYEDGSVHNHAWTRKDGAEALEIVVKNAASHAEWA
jgi:hypothetical protein